MANQYFIFKERPEVGALITIDDEAAAHHIFTVMRTQPKEQLRLVFDKGELGLVEVVSVSDRSVRLIERLTEQSELPVAVTVVVGFPKGDKLDFVTEKATELGASAIWSAPFKWSVAKWDRKKLAKKQEKLKKIARGAAEQSQRLQIPQVELFEDFTTFLTQCKDFDQILVAYEETAKAGEMSGLKKALTELSVGKKVLLVFGPEGGISTQEVEKFEALGAKLIGLGPRILRAETAPLYALSAFSTYFELL